MKREGHNHKDPSCAICALDRTGLRVTKQRETIVDVLFDVDNPISADEIHYELKSRDVDINLSTVYRSLEKFVVNDLVEKTFLLDENKALYAINTHEHHHHLVCRNCKNVVVIPGCPLESYELEVEKDYGYKISGHKLELYGVCPKCQK
ncbi:MAG TPA: Fur family transcriptional regulator [Clostridia bacterium]|nr:Fur family transcriptional regulator [Clostridia bacterium]